EVKDGKPSIKLAYLIKSDTSKESHERIDYTITELKYVASKVGAEVVAKESSIIRQVSSATPVIKTHAVFEHELADKYRLVEVSNSKVKVWVRTVIVTDGSYKDK